MKQFRMWLALKFCPELADELSILRSVNTKLTLKLSNEEKYIRGKQ